MHFHAGGAPSVLASAWLPHAIEDKMSDCSRLSLRGNAAIQEPLALRLPAETRRRTACRPHSPAELTGPTGVVELQAVTRARFRPRAGRAVVSQAAFASSGTLCVGLVTARSWAV